MNLKSDESFCKVLSRVLDYAESENFEGYDPYDTLNAKLPIDKFGKWVPAIAIQIQKRNPVNLRPLLGIDKEHNPKALGLFLKTYSILYQQTGNEQYLKTANKLYEYILNCRSIGFSGSAWGYNFDWANPGNVVKAYSPSVVVTAFVCDGLWEYYRITEFEKVKKEIISACEYITNDLPVTKLQGGLSIAYTHTSKGCCYNASMLGAETLAKGYFFTKSEKYKKLLAGSLDFVLSRQKDDGSWYYSYDPETGKERKQIDFHQGFILQSLDKISTLTDYNNSKIEKSIKEGLKFYFKHQFFADGRSKWRLPKELPVEIHNQAQGIITFSTLGQKYNIHPDFAETIANWTVENMMDESGFFYYQKHRWYTIKIPYMRWAQAWMALALAQLKTEKGTLD